MFKKLKGGKNILEFLLIIGSIYLGGIAGHVLLETWWGSILGACIVILAWFIHVLRNPKFPGD